MLIALLGAAFFASAASAVSYPYTVTTTTDWPWVGHNPVTFTGGVATVSLPWAFNIYGTTYNSVKIVRNGTLQFGSWSTYTGGSDGCLPSLRFGGPTIAPLWSDFAMTDTSGPEPEGAWYSSYNNQTYGNVFVVEWTGHISGIYPPAKVTFEAVLVQATNQIQMTYDTAVPTSYINASTVGIQGSVGLATQYSCWFGAPQAIPQYTMTTYTPQVPLSTGIPTITGTPALGQTLSVSNGTWNPARGLVHL